MNSLTKYPGLEELRAVARVPGLIKKLLEEVLAGPDPEALSSKISDSIPEKEV